MTEKYVWLIGGSQMAEPMAQEIKRRGYKLLITDGDPTCHCKQFADLFHNLNVYDVKAHLNFARSLRTDGEISDYEIIGVLTIGTDAGPTVSALSDAFGFPGIGQPTAELVKDKVMMRKTLGLAAPYFFVHKAGDRAGYFEPDLFPMIVKPPDQAGSRGIVIVNNQDELDEYISENDKDLLFEQVLIGEDVIPAWREDYGFDTSEAAFDYFIEDGEPIYANGALRMFWVDQPTIEAGHINPFPDNNEIRKIARAAARDLGVRWGPFKIDVKKDLRYGWCLLETATRLSGGYDHMYTSPLATGRDITGVMLDVALGGKVDRAKLSRRKFLTACCISPRYEPGELIHWQKSSKNADYLFISRHDRIPKLTCNQDRPAFVICAGLTENDALKRALVAASELKPVYRGI